MGCELVIFAGTSIIMGFTAGAAKVVKYQPSGSLDGAVEPA